MERKRRWQGPAGSRELLTIGVFARRTRLSLKALRLYDRIGLLTPADVDPRSGYRRYRESQLAAARLVVMLRRLDMPLGDVATIVNASRDTAVERLTTYWAGVERRVAGQRELVAHVRTRLSGETEPATFGATRVRDVPEQLVLTERSGVQVEQLPSWIGASMRRLADAARECGGIVGAPFVIYHGEVNEDSDGPVEACVPVADTARGIENRTRREPAHREAYVRLTKAQVGFPQILSAYDSVVAWAAAQGLVVNGSPREIYFRDFTSANPADPVCDVALPIE